MSGHILAINNTRESAIATATLYTKTNEKPRKNQRKPNHIERVQCLNAETEIVQYH